MPAAVAVCRFAARAGQARLGGACRILTGGCPPRLRALQPCPFPAPPTPRQCARAQPTALAPPAGSIAGRSCLARTARVGRRQLALMPELTPADGATMVRLPSPVHPSSRPNASTTAPGAPQGPQGPKAPKTQADASALLDLGSLLVQGSLLAHAGPSA